MTTDHYDNAELAAMASCYQTLALLDPAARTRAAEWILDRVRSEASVVALYWADPRGDGFGDG